MFNKLEAIRNTTRTESVCVRGRAQLLQQLDALSPLQRFIIHAHMYDRCLMVLQQLEILRQGGPLTMSPPPRSASDAEADFARWMLFNKPTYLVPHT